MIHVPLSVVFGLDLLKVVTSQAKYTPSRRYGYSKIYTPTRLTANQTTQLGCTDSHIPNHVILQSWYNSMLGEFYDRALVGLFEFLQAQEVSIDEFAQHSQLYIHRMDPFKPLMDSHQVFTEAFRSSALGDLLQLMDATRCRCLPRVLLCGYEQKRNRTTKTTTLVPSGSVFVRSRQPTATYAKMRNFLRRKMILNNPFAVTDVRNFRHAVLQRHMSLRNLTRPIMEWKIVGLTQRSGRRRWLNLTQVIQNLTQPMLDKGVVLLEVNVENEDWTPYRHVIRHAALDGLVGIHGAQLTEAIWMKPGSLVAELLPYVPNNTSYGKWTTTTHKATPLGVIFDETDLLHVGYRLGRESAPYCYNETDDCWGWQKYPWDARDFIASTDVVSTILELFVLNRPQTCDEYRDTSMSVKDVVVYNSPCAYASAPRDVKPHHFYWNVTTKAIS